MQDPLPYEREFTSDSLRQLTNGDIDLIWHKGFYPESACKAVLPRIVAACEAARYTLTDDLQSIGTSIGEAEKSREAAHRYLRTAPNTTKFVRDVIFAEYKSPADVVRLCSDEYWPNGATVGVCMGQKMLPGIIRRWPTGGHANPHIDGRNIPLLSSYKLGKRIGVNVYIETPTTGCGGEVEFWDKYNDESLYASRKRPDYGLDRETLGDPICVISPHQGDLLMFDAARVHGVRRVTSGSRVTAACFLGFTTECDPLIVFA